MERLAARRARPRRRLRRAPRPQQLDRTAETSPRPLSPAFEDVAEALASGLRTGIAGGVPLAGVTLEVEPGRALHADTGIHLTRVVNLKQQREPLAWRWVETDTTEMFLLDLLVEHCHFPVVAATRMGEAVAEPVDVVGCSCGFDVLAHQVRLPAVELGDTLAFLDTGAYEDACAANFNALPRPAIVLVSGDRAEIVRRAETIEDVFARGPGAGAVAAVTVRGIDHAGITVASIKAALVFYRDLLGLRVTDEGEDPGPELDAITGLSGMRIRYAELDLGGGQLLEVIEYTPPDGGRLFQRPVRHAAPPHLALRVDDVDAVCARLLAAGATVPGRPTTISAPGRWNGARCVYVEDPDGRTVELVQRPA